MPLHSPVHVPVRLLPGEGTSQTAVWVPAGSARSWGGELVLESREGGNHWQRGSGESDGHCGEKTSYLAGSFAEPEFKECIATFIVVCCAVVIKFI